MSLLEVTRLALDEMGRWRMELSESGKSSGGQWAPLSRTYGNVRRLRDHIQTCLDNSEVDVTVEMSEDQRNLLVSCIGYYVRGVSGSEKQEDLISQAVELATREVADLPVPSVADMHAPGLHKLRKKVIEKVRPPKKETPAAVSPGGTEVSGNEDSGAAAEPAVTEKRAPAEEPVLPLDVQRMRDPKLQAIAALDQCALGRALQDQDHRMATVHLFSILEATMLDSVMVRRKELGLADPPESWDMQALVLKLLGDDTSDQERRALDTICTGGNLISPFSQCAQPIVVTPGDWDVQLEVMKKVLAQLGYTDSVTPEPSDEPSETPE